MDIFNAMKISSSGLSAQQLRMNVLSSNLANAQATRGGPDGGPYRRQDVVFEAAPTSANPFEQMLDEAHGTQLTNVKVREIHSDPKPPRRVYEPSHPDADKDGYVSMPNIQVMSEMVNMIAATRAYEANTTALNNAKQMAMKALEIGR
jgi:flagellar basal-body rod protein FlgC